MSAADSNDDRSRLDGCEIELFQLVKKGATPRQWREWLRAPLEHAAADGNLDLFTRLMDAGADGSAGWRGCHGRTLLGAAARGKKERIVSALLEAGAKPDISVTFGDCGVRVAALHVAAAQGAESVAKVLMSAGADPNQLDGYNYTPLHLAAEGKDHSLVAKLLLREALPNARTTSLDTPLHLSVTKNCGQETEKDGCCARCVSHLLAHGADQRRTQQPG